MRVSPRPSFAERGGKYSVLWAALDRKLSEKKVIDARRAGPTNVADLHGDTEIGVELVALCGGKWGAGDNGCAGRRSRRKGGVKLGAGRGETQAGKRLLVGVFTALVVQTLMECTTANGTER